MELTSEQEYQIKEALTLLHRLDGLKQSIWHKQVEAVCDCDIADESWKELVYIMHKVKGWISTYVDPMSGALRYTLTPQGKTALLGL